MKKVTKLIKTLVLLGIVFTMTTIPVLAKETSTMVEKKFEVASLKASSTIVAPDGNTYNLLGTATRSKSLSSLMRSTVAASDGYKLAFYCPNGLVQGTVTAVPIFGGTAQSFSFNSYSNQISIIDLADLSGSGKNRIQINAYAIGSSDSSIVYWRLYK